MPSCIKCDTQITGANDSREHIITNAIGGRLKVRGVLCNHCNNTTGKTWDAELARQLNPLSLMFTIKRERGGPPSQIFRTADGSSRRLNADGTSTPPHPTYEEKKTDTGVSISVTLRSMDEAPSMLAGIKRKYPQVNLEAIKAQMTLSTVYDKTPITMDLTVGGPIAGRSIVKSALCLAASAGVSAANCNLARAYLLGDDSCSPFGFYYQTDLVLDRPEDKVFHCVAVSGHPSSRLLVGYVEFFSFHRMVVLLSDHYDGPTLHHSYAVNPLNGEKVSLRFNLSLTREEIEAAFRYGRIPEGSMEAALDRIMPIAMSRSFDRERERVISAAVRYAFANSGIKPGEMITAEHTGKIAALATERMMPFL